jgi:hypothetical protein
MRKCSILLLLALGVVSSSPSLAFEGRYRGGGGGYDQELIIKKRGVDSYAVELVVGTPGCTGAFDGIGRVEGARLAVRTPPPADPNDKCVISVSRRGAVLEVTEDRCTDFHGASCEFSGKYKKR